MKLSPVALAIAAGVGLLAFSMSSQAATVTATGGARNVTGGPQTLSNGTAGGTAGPSGGKALAGLVDAFAGLFGGGGASAAPVTPASVVPGNGLAVNQATTNTPALDVAAIIGASSVVGNAPAFQPAGADFVNTPTVPVAATVPAASSGTASAATAAPPFWFEPPAPVVTAQASPAAPVAVVPPTVPADRVDEETGVLMRWDDEEGRYKRVRGSDGD